MRAARIITGLVLVGALAVGGWVGFVWWYYYKGEGQETAYRTEAYMEALEIRVTPIRDGLFLLQGDGGNVTALTGPEGVLIVDTDERWVYPKMQAALDALGSGPVRYVVNTHAHGDHRGGNAGFRAGGAEIVAHPAAAESIRADDSPEITEADVPTILVEHGDSLTFNGQDLTFHHPPLAHTDGDLIVRFSPANVIAAGDVVVANGVPYIGVPTGASLAGHLEGQDVVMALADGETVIVPGHGPLHSRAELAVLQARLGAVGDRVAWLKGMGVPSRFVPLFHPLWDWPMALHRGHGWEKFWLGLVYRTLP